MSASWIKCPDFLTLQDLFSIPLLPNIGLKGGQIIYLNYPFAPRFGSQKEADNTQLITVPVAKIGNSHQNRYQSPK